MGRVLASVGRGIVAGCKRSQSMANAYTNLEVSGLRRSFIAHLPTLSMKGHSQAAGGSQDEAQVGRGHPCVPTRVRPYAGHVGGLRQGAGGQGIRINAVSPGVIKTPTLEVYFEEQPEIAEGLKRAAVMNRLGEPNEIAEAVTFLSSDRASFITGQLLSVDGGGAVR